MKPLLFSMLLLVAAPVFADSVPRLPEPAATTPHYYHRPRGLRFARVAAHHGLEYKSQGVYYGTTWDNDKFISYDVCERIRWRTLRGRMRTMHEWRIVAELRLRPGGVQLMVDGIWGLRFNVCLGQRRDPA